MVSNTTAEPVGIFVTIARSLLGGLGGAPGGADNKIFVNAPLWSVGIFDPVRFHPAGRDGVRSYLLTPRRKLWPMARRNGSPTALTEAS
jgi:hypothetical protein